MQLVQQKEIIEMLLQCAYHSCGSNMAPKIVRDGCIGASLMALHLKGCVPDKQITLLAGDYDPDDITIDNLVANEPLLSGSLVRQIALSGHPTCASPTPAAVKAKMKMLAHFF